MVRNSVERVHDYRYANTIAIFADYDCHVDRHGDHPPHAPPGVDRLRPNDFQRLKLPHGLDVDYC